jgi:excisionase family DNA binding protein
VEKSCKKKTLTISEAAEVLGIGRTSAYEAARRGEIPTIRIGKLLLVPATQLERLLNGEIADTSDKSEN